MNPINRTRSILKSLVFRGTDWTKWVWRNTISYRMVPESLTSGHKRFWTPLIRTDSVFHQPCKRFIKNIINRQPYRPSYRPERVSSCAIGWVFKLKQMTQTVPPSLSSTAHTKSCGKSWPKKESIKMQKALMSTDMIWNSSGLWYCFG